MRSNFTAFFGALILSLACFIRVEAQTGNTSFAPVAPVKPVIDAYHGVKVSDRRTLPYDPPTIRVEFKAVRHAGSEASR